MRHLGKALLTAALLIGTFPLSAAAKPPLRDVAVIDDAVFDVGLAHIISEECPSIAPRKIKGGLFLMKLKREANALGYSDAEIDAYRKSDTEKARLKARGKAFFKARGVDTSDPQSYCVLGLEEIQKSSRIGSLLKAN